MVLLYKPTNTAYKQADKTERRQARHAILTHILGLFYQQTHDYLCSDCSDKPLFVRYQSTLADWYDDNGRALSATLEFCEQDFGDLSKGGNDTYTVVKYSFYRDGSVGSMVSHFGKKIMGRIACGLARRNWHTWQLDKESCPPACLLTTAQTFYSDKVAFENCMAKLSQFLMTDVLSANDIVQFHRQKQLGKEFYQDWEVTYDVMVDSL